MKKHNNAIVKQLRAYATPMNKFALFEWLEANLANTDISATVSSSVDRRGFVAHDIELSDGKGSDRRFTVPTLAEDFTFDAHGIYAVYGIISPKARFRNKNMYIVAHAKGYILVSYKTMIAFYHFEQNTVYFKRNSYTWSTTTTRHIYEFLTHFVNADAIKMFAKQKDTHD